MKVSEIKIGETYNGVKVLEKFREKGHTKYWCICPVCGKRFSLRAEEVGNTHQCKKCYDKSHFNNLSGRRFGRLIAVRFAKRAKGGTTWECVCDCGNHKVVSYQGLVSGRTRSCGCLRSELMLRGVGNNRKSASMKLGCLRKNPLYNRWTLMKDRCYNSTNVAYANYGGRGIKVCDRWLGEHGFENFLADMGERPSKEYSIDRIDVNGDYTPENCRWATTDEQNANKRNSVYIEMPTGRIFFLQFCRQYGLPYSRMVNILSRGIDINAIIKQVLLKTKKRYINHCNNNRVISDEVMELLKQHQLI